MYINDLDGYAKDLDTALKIYPDDPVALYNRAQLFLNLKQFNDALQDADAAIKAGGKKAEFHIQRAEIFVGMGKKDLAIADYQLALKVTENDKDRRVLTDKIEKLKQN